MHKLATKGPSEEELKAVQSHLLKKKGGRTVPKLIFFSPPGIVVVVTAKKINQREGKSHEWVIIGSFDNVFAGYPSVSVEYNSSTKEGLMTRAQV